MTNDPSKTAGPSTPESLRFDGDGDGVTLAADAWGDANAPTVLLFHGGGQTRHSWHNTARNLAGAGWRAITVDLRGHGDSDWSPDGVYHIDRFSADVAAVAKAQRSRPALVGASLGGISSLYAVARFGNDLAKALVLVDVAPRIERSGADRIGDFMRSGLGGFASLEEAADAIHAYNPHRPRPADLSGLTKNLRHREDGRWYWHWDPKFMMRAPNAQIELGLDGLPKPNYIPEEQLSEAAKSITIPTLLVRGGASDLLSEEGAQHLLSLIPHARYTNVAGAGHMVAGDRNDRFNAAVVDFLNDDVGPVRQ